MACNRFRDIQRFLHVVNAEAPPHGAEKPGTHQDLFWRMRPLVLILQTNFNKFLLPGKFQVRLLFIDQNVVFPLLCAMYSCDRVQTIDEGLAPFKGRHRARQVSATLAHCLSHCARRST